jgi:ABC-2 type transport system ATP-binding protein
VFSRESYDDLPVPLGIRTADLKKIFTTAPPLASAGIRGAPFSGIKRKKQATRIVALDGVSLDIHPGEIFTLLGPNGAGKTTTVGVLTTRVRPTSGDAWIGPHHVWRELVQVKRLIGVVPQRPNLDFSLTAREILMFHGAYFQVPPGVRAKRASGLLDRFQLSERAGELPLTFSGGMLQRLSIARALMHDPEVLFLDEPSAGLDPQTRLLLWDIIREYHARGKTILLTTHNMEEADALSDRLAIVDHGKVIALGTPEELKRSVPGGFLVQLQLRNAPPDLLADLGRLQGVTEVRPGANGAVSIYADRGGALVPEIVRMTADANSNIHDIHISEPSLENLFLHHTGRSLRQ